MSQFAMGRNYTGELQLKLQAKAPHLGCSCQELWRFEDVTCGPFSVRVLLLNSKCPENTLKLPVSDGFSNKKIAKQHASWRAIAWMQEHEQSLVFVDSSFSIASPRRTATIRRTTVERSSTTGSAGSKGQKALCAPLCRYPLSPWNPVETTSPSSKILIREGGISPYPYQLQMTDAAIKGNTIVNIRTGAGKTLIAVMVLDHFLVNHPHRKILFVVPTRALVIQQSAYIRSHSSQPVLVAELSGPLIESWGQSEWLECQTKHHVLVGTAEVFRIGLVDHGYLHPHLFSLIIFDECHNATGNSPMAAIMLDSVSHHYAKQDTQHENILPRILGLTASFVSGSLGATSAIERKRAKLCSLLLSTLISPETIEQFGADKNYHFMEVPSEPVPLADSKDWVEGIAQRVLRTVPDRLITAKEMNKWVRKGWTVFESLGRAGFVYWLREGVLLQLQGKADSLLAQSTDMNCMRMGQLMKHSLLRLKDSLLNAIPEEPGPPQELAPEHTQKVLVLIDMLQRRSLESSSLFRGIIFVEQVALTYPLAHLVNCFFRSHHVESGSILSPSQKSEDSTNRSSSLPWPALPVSGAGSMQEQIRNACLESFKRGDTAVLVSTAALEEGIDVTDCSFVVRFDDMKTTKAHIQGSGRARCANADIFYFENNPLEECLKAEDLEAVARNESLNRTHMQLQECSNQRVGDEALASTGIRYPFICGGADATENAEVNIFNCVTILYQYVQMVMGQSVSPEECLFEVTEQKVMNIPLTTVRTLQSVSIPSPSGIIVIRLADVNRFWKSVAIENIVKPPERLKNMSTFDIEVRRAVYVAVLRLHDEGYMTPTNMPSEVAKAGSKLACPAFHMRDRMTLRNKFRVTSLCPDNNDSS